LPPKQQHKKKQIPRPVQKEELLAEAMWKVNLIPGKSCARQTRPQSLCAFLLPVEVLRRNQSAHNGRPAGHENANGQISIINFSWPETSVFFGWNFAVQEAISLQ
jgi:hypothetical protein